MKVKVKYVASYTVQLECIAEVDVPDDLSDIEATDYIENHQQDIDGGDYAQLEGQDWSNDGYTILEDEDA